jgi:hypothetical protein
MSLAQNRISPTDKAKKPTITATKTKSISTPLFRLQLSTIYADADKEADQFRLPGVNIT